MGHTGSCFMSLALEYKELSCLQMIMANTALFKNMNDSQSMKTGQM
jgi:hypothetical protein